MKIISLILICILFAFLFFNVSEVSPFLLSLAESSSDIVSFIGSFVVELAEVVQSIFIYPYLTKFILILLFQLVVAYSFSLFGVVKSDA